MLDGLKTICMYQGLEQAWLETCWFCFRLKPIFAKALVVPKNIPHLKSGIQWPKNNHLASFTKSESKSQIHLQR